MTAAFDDFDPGLLRSDLGVEEEPPPLLDGRGSGWISEALLDWLTQQLKPPWWHKAAACRGADTALFFVERGGKTSPAKAICAECPVLNVCLDWSLSEPESLEGIWGGMSRKERRVERKRRRLTVQVA